MSAQQLQYQRVKEYIVQGIESGRWREGEMIPSENELAQHFSLSRMTANRAVKELEADGWLDRVAGKGTFVAEAKSLQSVLSIGGIDEEIRNRGNRYSNRVIHLKKVCARQAIAGEMQVPHGSEIFSSLVLHLENEIPVQLENRYVNPSIAPKYLEQDFTKITSHEYLTKLSPLTRGEHTISAAMPSGRARQSLKMEEGEPCLEIWRRTWVGKTVATVAKLTHPGSRYKLVTEHHAAGRHS